MFDSTKRKMLKVLGSSAALAAIPSISKATQAVSGLASSTIDGSSVGSAELTAELSMGYQPMINLTNHTDQLIEVKHVHPGIVHAGYTTLDINSVFKNGALAIKPGESRSFPVGTTHSTQAETTFPRHLYQKMPQRVVSVTGNDVQGTFINSSRSFYA